MFKKNLKTKLKKIAEELGISEDELLKKTYPALLIEKGKWKIN